ncbi:hypothetical protein BO83DRAFT_376081 [Aspergillus eucalypticola CBS 122712]|uniref:Uncharacterized protein n=1 Tax=Aspergillus eucalypticola (strain CBS 122712 / IBT 29274) TaxID=1448314 RepID=A0A317W2M6_ASPEC|nr:uncharacterized protein BO83DRAFT_376081 [Aspergillus eucalypticola CBS 122712]PWY80149.1 hypothetical protein BO83DRAFT_376081 [Aspergillus eucalypticola CBS 122712]
MTLENQVNSRPRSRQVSRTRRFFETMAITSVTSLVVGTLEDVFLASVDPRSWLHFILYISCYTMFNFLYEKVRSM